MSKLIIGIDPDSHKLGVAKCRSGALCELLNMNVIELYIHLTTFEKEALSAGEVAIHMENPKGSSSSAFNHKKGLTQAAKFKISEKVGMVKQAQSSVEQMAEILNIPVVHHRNSSAWKKGAQADLFKRITGWVGRSNEETRSAAYFAWLGCKK